jgi:hypothetical protein
LTLRRGYADLPRLWDSCARGISFLHESAHSSTSNYERAVYTRASSTLQCATVESGVFWGPKEPSESPHVEFGGRCSKISHLEESRKNILRE